KILVSVVRFRPRAPLINHCFAMVFSTQELAEIVRTLLRDDSGTTDFPPLIDWFRHDYWHIGVSGET
ncbi:MAG: hypothetical protein VXW58_05465, partial [Pseudomonadota bacterium]|nr:hypothetical protein [Pseudomonadota bacterium]